MTSQYTTSLKIQEIGSGEQSGYWGTTTNTNWTLIEQAVAGVQTITMANADYTLTNLNGVLDEARNMVLVIQGTNSAIRKVIAPLNQPKIYIVSNQTTGGYAITIGASSGSIITVPNGTTAQVYTDGTNFYSSQTGSAGNFTVNGDLSVTGSSTETGNLAAAGSLYAYTAATSTASSISGTTLTIGGTVTGAFFVGQTISGSGVTSGTTITALGSGTGGAGTYTVSATPTTNPTGTIAINGAAGVSLVNPYISGALAIGGALSTGGGATIGGNTAITGTLSVTADASFTGTGEIIVPVGTTAQRTVLPTEGMLRYNTTLNTFEGYIATAGQTISSITYVTTTATLTTATAHGLTTGMVVTISGASPAAYNGTFSITVTDTTHFTYTMVSNPGANATSVGSYLSGAWGPFGGVTGLVASGTIYENGQTISANYTMTAGNSGESVGPITIATGITVTIPTGSRWVVL